jgi:Zn-finger nucleic acid-binding protein
VNCPSCEHALEPTDLDHVVIHDCPQCHGMWFERDQLKRATDNANQWLRWIDFDVFAAAEASAERGDACCPACGRQMTTLVYPHSRVKIDVCAADHGVWLDGGEFDKIVTALDDLTNQLSEQDYERASLQELRKMISGGQESRLSEFRDFTAIFRLLEMRLGAEHPLVAAAVDIVSQAGL